MAELDNFPDLQNLRVGIWDMNGVLRGKLLPRKMAAKAFKGEVKLPVSALGVDIWGRDVVSSGYVMETGDNDGICRPTERGLLPLSWTEGQSAILPVWMFEENGDPGPSDPRQCLAKVLSEFKSIGLTPVCATELEFYLFDLEAATLRAPASLGGAKTVPANAMYAISDIDILEDFLRDVYAACEAMDIPADAAISENGCGQVEINFYHSPDALKAADDTLLFKYIVRSIARKNGFGATFMAKPYGEESGSGMHVHFSLINADGDNIFDDGTDAGSDQLRQSLAGLMATMTDTMLVYAPHLNSYRRVRPGTHAPVNIGWGYDNRTTPLRIPSGPNAARRIEHRVAGADANPYLVLTAILGGALMGLKNQMDAVPAIEGNAYDQDLPQIPTQWMDAITAFEQSENTGAIFGEIFKTMFIAAKRQEYDLFATKISEFERDSYLEAF